MEMWFKVLKLVLTEQIKLQLRRPFTNRVQMTCFEIRANSGRSCLDICA